MSTIKPYPFICLFGFARTGKDSFADALRPQYRVVGFADQIRIELGDTIRNSFHVEDPWHDRHKQAVRPLLVEWGQLARHFDSDHWIRPIRSYMRLFPHLIVKDLRYMHEAMWAHSVGAKLIYISRPGVGPANEQEADEIPAIVNNFEHLALVNYGDLKTWQSIAINVCT